MISIAFRFLAGRYHATPWGHHVNEGLVEWPPSPFRVLRALVAAYYKHPGELSEELVQRAISRLEGAPVYQLPASVESHTRQYIPAENDDKALVFDAFAAIDGGAGGNSTDDDEELVVTWKAEGITPEERHALDQLCRRINYLGRSESWAEARLVDEPMRSPDAIPIVENGGDDDVDSATSLLTPLDSNVYAGWRLGFLEGQRDKKLLPPETRWDVLSNDNETIQKQGWRIPPGTRWVRYALRSRSKPERPFQSCSTLPTFARFALASSVLPLAKTGISVAERFRTSLMSHSDAHEIFAGRHGGAPSAAQHQHAFYLPTDDDGDGRIDHVVVWAQGGFDARAVQALQRLRRVWGTGGHDLHTTLVGLGAPRDYAGARGDGSDTRISQTSTRWKSSSPFVLTRHPKRKAGVWVDTPEQQVAKACEYLLEKTPVDVRIIPLDRNEVSPWRGFYLERKQGGGSMGPRRAYSFEITFNEAVSGPLALGYGAHFGLGQFQPA